MEENRMDDFRNDKKDNCMEKPKDSLKKPIVFYFLGLVALTIAAVIIGCMIHVAPIIRGVKNLFHGSVRLKDFIVDIGDIDVGDIEVDDIEVKFPDDFGININTDGIHIDGAETGSWQPDNPDGIRKIEVEADVVNLIIVGGDTLEAQWECSGFLAPGFTVDGDTLKIRQGDSTESKGFNLGSLLDLSNLDSHLVLTVPKDIYLEDLEADVSCGNVQISGVKSRNAEIDADCGNIVLANGEYGNLEVAADCGNVELNHVSADKAELQADFGRVSVSGGSYDTLDAKADCGEIECKEITADSVSLIADMGGISISGDYKALKADCSVGSITVTTTRPESEVQLNLSADLGSVTVNGKER